MRNIILVLMLCALTFQVRAQEPTYFLNGDATYLGDDCYQLTPAVNTQNGTVWYADQINLEEAFTIEFLMLLGSNNGGADGICFVLQQEGTDAIGESGGGMGYLNFTGTFAIEFDTWQNTNYNDPLQDHIAVISNGNVDHNASTNIWGPVFMTTTGGNVEDGEYHVVKISWDPEANNNLRVWWDCVPRINISYDIIGNWFSDDPNVYWGFTGATGGANNQQAVCLEENIIGVGTDVTICTGASTELNFSGDPDIEYSWSPEEGLDDPNIQNPVASPDTTTAYVVSYLNLCGDITTDTVTVTVQDLEVNIDPAELTCENPEISLNAETNFNNSLDYDWETADGNILFGSGSATPAIDEPGTYICNAEYDGICIDSDTIEVIGNWVFEATVNDPPVITCLLESVDLTVEATSNADIDYAWSTNGGSIASGIFGPSIVAAAGGEYTVIVSVNEFCADTVTVEVNADNIPYELSIADPPQVDCDTPTVTLDVTTDGEDGDITWTTTGNIVSGADGISPVIDAGGTYTLNILNPENGCESEASIEVDEDFTPPVVNAGPQDTLTCRDPVAVLQGSSDGTYSIAWTTDIGNILEGGSTLNPQVDAPGTYTVTATNPANGCQDEDAVEIVVTEDFFLDLSSLVLPNVFTPGNDQMNDRYGPFLIDDPEFDLVSVMPVYELLIFNRWGNLVFESNRENSPAWDGTVTSGDATTGTFYATFVYEVDCGTEQKGSLQTALQVIR